MPATATRRPGGSAPWEVLFLHRPSPRRQPRVAGCLRFDARDAAAARLIAEDGLAQRAGGEPDWTLGPLRPMAPSLQGTHRYRVTFAMWREGEGRFVREDVFTTTLWATDGQSARRLACREAQSAPSHRGAWRIREVLRTA